MHTRLSAGLLFVGLANMIEVCRDYHGAAATLSAHVSQGNNWLGATVITLLANFDLRCLFVLPVLGIYLFFHECWPVQKVSKSAVIDSGKQGVLGASFARKVHFSVHSFVSLWIIVLSIFFAAVGPFFVKENVSPAALATTGRTSRFFFLSLSDATARPHVSQPLLIKRLPQDFRGTLQKLCHNLVPWSDTVLPLEKALPNVPFFFQATVARLSHRIRPGTHHIHTFWHCPALVRAVRTPHHFFPFIPLQCFHVKLWNLHTECALSCRSIR